MGDDARVYAGVDTHKDKHVLCVLDQMGRKVLTEEFSADADGYERLAAAIGDPSGCAVVGVEGTSSYGAGLSRRLSALGYEVVEVLRPKRDKRRRGAGKNDEIDAERAARRAAAGDGTSVPKSMDGWVEAVRSLSCARNLAVGMRTRAANAARSLLETAPEQVRARYSGLGTATLMARLSRKGKPSGDVVKDSLMASPRSLARAWRGADDEADELEGRIERLVGDNAPALLEVEGLGPVGAAALAIAAGDNPGRMVSEAAFASLCGVAPIEASSGKTVRHRLNRGGNRAANSALHTVVVNRMKYDGRTSEYVARRTSEGKSKRETIRCLKRYVAREVYRALMSPKATAHARGLDLRKSRLGLGWTQAQVAEALGTQPIRISEIEREARKHFDIRDRYEGLMIDLSKKYGMALDTA